MICEKHPILKSIDDLVALMHNGHKVSFTLYRTKRVSSLSAKGSLGGADPKLTVPLCDIVLSPLGFRVYWRAKNFPPKAWGIRTSPQDFERGLSELSQHLLTIGELRIK